MDFVVFGVFVVVACVLTLVMYLVASSRKGSVGAVAMTNRRIVLHSAAPPGAVYSWLTQYCPPGYSVEDADPANGIVVLSSKPTFFTYGFFFPAIVCTEGTGTRVDLGIKSRLFQYGPLVTKAHREIAHALANLTQSRVEGA
ncbi:hypothetical protein [Umezawaea sp. Da 62-37]|uniref:hypothetical protein n=1 Tax=Umezawaea sp. Da 62-37 TaxID=3075927 RepID=UPI0028F739A7|nr:hypothetical protein [Umezawaea sp. Da 62-37]WNV86378.1 hypothetical protein RM788_51100 [Umezawaea sp. Da 62-37]